jgi:hypothetical protein
MKITIIGSVYFADRFVDTYNELRKLGHEPVIHEHMFEYSKTSWEEFHGRKKRERTNEKIKYDYIKWWYNSICDSDAILVLNFEKKGVKNYIGANVLMEIGFAHVNGKKIFLINPIPESGVAGLDELKAMVNTDNILHGDLQKIV